MPQTRRKLTYDDYASIPDDGLRHEIISGEEVVTPAPQTPHQFISMKLGSALHQHATRRALGVVLCAPVDVLLGPFDIVQPDIVFVSTARSAIVTPANIQGAPDLVVEILSPSTATIDRGKKLELYRRSGVREYWIVDSDAETVEAHDFAAGDTRSLTRDSDLTSSVLPDLTIRLADLF